MRLVVLSYNILHSQGASRLLRGRAPGPWAHDRLHRVAELIKRHDPDFACLQEVDADAHATLSKVLGSDFECAAHMINESLPPQDGCAVFVRSSRFDVQRTHQFRMRDTVMRHMPKFETLRTQGSGLAAALWRELHEKLNLSVAVSVRARPEERACGLGSEELCIATSHLFWDPRYPDLKLLQAFLLVRELDSFMPSSPLVLAGDLNSTPHLEGGGVSGVYALLTRGDVPPDHPHHPVALRRGVGILRGVAVSDMPQLSVPPLLSAYREAQGYEGPITNASRDFTGCLDYILYRRCGADFNAADAIAAADSKTVSLRLVAVRPLPTEEALKGHLPLPSSEHPSDHLPLVAEFELLSSESKSPTHALPLLARVR